MISHTHVGIADLDRAVAFYDAVLPSLGWKHRFTDHERGWAGWEPAHGGRPLFLVGTPIDGNVAHNGNGHMIALLAEKRSKVDAAHAQALASGGISEGAPGLRPEYHTNYYGTYFRDPDGNKICVCCHDAE